MKATEQYFPVVMFVMQYKVVLTFASVDEIDVHVGKIYNLILALPVGVFVIQDGSVSWMVLVSRQTQCMDPKK